MLWQIKRNQVCNMPCTRRLFVHLSVCSLCILISFVQRAPVCSRHTAYKSISYRRYNIIRFNCTSTCTGLHILCVQLRTYRVQPQPLGARVNSLFLSKGTVYLLFHGYREWSNSRERARFNVRQQSLTLLYILDLLTRAILLISEEFLYLVDFQ